MSKMSCEIKKIKQGMSYSCKEKTIILNVFKYLRNEFPDLSVTEVVRRTSRATGCSEKSIFMFRKEEATGGFKVPSKKKIRKNININSRDIKYDNSVREAIKDIIYDLKNKSINPSLNKILNEVHFHKHLPTFSLMTLRRLIFDMGFSYQKVGNKSILICPERDKNTVESKKKCQTEVQGNIETAYCQNVSQPLPKPIPQHAVSHISGNVNLHMGHMGQPIGHQSSHQQIMPMQAGYPSNAIMQSMHSQPPMTHNMPMLNHPVYASQLGPPPPHEMYPKRGDFLQ